MKKTLIHLFTICALSSCQQLQDWNPFNKNENNDKASTPCLVVNADDVPALVIDSFYSKYMAAKVDVWYNVDRTG
ncbi:MAG: hypothetical protein LH473_07000 [Chitinophagales bacterium]|nr:hypothetical protein [Chitinophagales bacterium]